MSGIVDRVGQIECLDPAARHRLGNSLGDVRLLHEAEAQLEASYALGERRDDESIVFRRSRGLGHVGCDQQDSFMQDMVAIDIVRQR